MRITVLDAEKFSDLDWSPLRELGEVVLLERTRAAEVPAAAANAACLLTNKSPIGAAAIAALPELRYIGVLATGHNIVDGLAARARAIPVCNVPEYGTAAVAQHAIALLLELAQRPAAHAATVREGRWIEGKADWCYWDRSPLELAGRTLGLVGSGRIAQAVARVGQALGMAVLFATRRGGREELKGVLATSDVVSLHCPLTADTRELICSETLGWMKPEAILINTSRGGLVNDRDLADALNQGRLAAAGLDVLSVEPPPAGNPLLSARRCLITPHMAWAATSARARLLDTAFANVRAFLAGRPQNVVNDPPPKG